MPQNMTPPEDWDMADSSTEGSDYYTAESSQTGMPQNMTPPDGWMDGSLEMGNAPFQPGFEFESAESESEAAVTTILSYDRSVYILLLASIIVLGIGLAIAILYRR